MSNDYPLLTVTVVAMVCMMSMLILGTYYTALMPKSDKVIVYECDFELRDSVLTMPCTIRGEWNE